VPSYRALARPPRLVGPLVEALAATHRTRAQQARILGISRAQLQDRLSGRRGARGWTTAEARRLVEQHRDIAVAVDNTATIGILDDCTPEHDASVAVCEPCENVVSIGAYAECGAGTAT